ncbi:hypothetical protein B0H12DRAFT_1082867 [Mycena haematopus]|nr:hypothetical protein B0H12DRAFT_1082867 [Mycena haematopus]
MSLIDRRNDVATATSLRIKLVLSPPPPSLPSYWDIGSKISPQCDLVLNHPHPLSAGTSIVRPVAFARRQARARHQILEFPQAQYTTKPSCTFKLSCTFKPLCAFKLPCAVNIPCTVQSSIPRAANSSRRQSLIRHQAHEALVGVKAWPGIMVPQWKTSSALVKWDKEHSEEVKMAAKFWTVAVRRKGTTSSRSMPDTSDGELGPEDDLIIVSAVSV